MMDAYNEEMSLARLALRCRNYTVCFSHLEQAHVLTQRMTGLHVHVHWLMLVVGWKQRDYREVAGQASRAVAALLFSRIWVPIGIPAGLASTR